jgi:amidophosphoribosyltransferase
VEADTLGYLDLEDLEGCMGDTDGQGFCYACFTGNYPVPPPAK